LPPKGQLPRSRQRQRGIGNLSQGCGDGRFHELRHRLNNLRHHRIAHLAIGLHVRRRKVPPANTRDIKTHEARGFPRSQSPRPPTSALPHKDLCSVLVIAGGDGARHILRAHEAIAKPVPGLPGALVEGTDAWLLEDLTETYSTAEDARPREGGLADEINAAPATLAWSNMGEAAVARRAAGEARRRKSARRQRRKVRKAAEDAG
jgi:hypothetical protein